MREAAMPEDIAVGYAQAECQHISVGEHGAAHSQQEHFGKALFGLYATADRRRGEGVCEDGRHGLMID